MKTSSSITLFTIGLTLNLVKERNKYMFIAIPCNLIDLSTSSSERDQRANLSLSQKRKKVNKKQIKRMWKNRVRLMRRVTNKMVHLPLLYRKLKSMKLMMIKNMIKIMKNNKNRAMSQLVMTQMTKRPS